MKTFDYVRTRVCLALLITTSAGVAHAQTSGTGLLSVGPVHVRAIEGSGWGGETNFAQYLPFEFLAGVSGVGPGIWVAELREPNTRNRQVLMFGLGVRWRTHWDLFGGRVRPQVVVPAELIFTGGGGVPDLACIEPINRPKPDFCQGQSRLGFGVGAGGGLDVVLINGVAVHGGLTGLFTNLDLNPGGMLWIASLGLSLRVIDGN